MSKIIEIKPDQSKSYLHASEALQDEGFQESGEGPNLYTKDGKTYKYNGMENYNTIIYSIWLECEKETTKEFRVVIPGYPESKTHDVKGKSAATVARRFFGRKQLEVRGYTEHDHCFEYTYTDKNGSVQGQVFEYK